MDKTIFLVLYMAMLTVNTCLFVYMKIKGKGIEDQISLIEIQNWMIYFMIMIELLGKEI